MPKPIMSSTTQVASWRLMIYPQDGDYYAAYRTSPTDLGCSSRMTPTGRRFCSPERCG